MTVEIIGQYKAKVSGHASKELAAALVRVQELTQVGNDLYLQNARAIQVEVDSWRVGEPGIIGNWILSVPFEERQHRILCYINNRDEAFVVSHPGGFGSVEPIQMTAGLIDEFASHPNLNGKLG